MAPTSKSYDPSPERERFQRLKRAAPTGSERAASLSESSSAGDSIGGGARLDLLSISGSPESKYTPPHARQGHGMDFAQAVRRNPTESPTCVVTTDDRDDVFTSPTKTLKERRSERSLTVANMQRLDVALANTEEHPLRERPSNLNARHQINGVDAQNLYPPTACVFVANLPEPKDDVALEAAIYREFLKYGKCWVKIRRDSHHMPFAFVQFTSDEEALEALEKGKGAMIFGRPCRTEMVKANRTFIIQKKNGAPITIDEAEKALLPFGSMNKCEVMHPQLREPLRLPPTVLVEFSMFDATRDLHQAFRHDSVYTVSAFDLKKNCAATRNNGDEAFLAACERDRRSIFVGDLPPNTTQEDLEDLFSSAGEILKVNLIQRPVNANASSYSNTQSSTVRTMAFVEFTQPDMPEVAIAKFHGQPFQGATMRVERKSVKDRGPTPRHSRSQLLLAHKASEESVGHGAAPSRAPASPAVVATPNRQQHPYGGINHGSAGAGNASAAAYHHQHGNHGPADMSSPAAPAGIPPPMYSQWAYGAASPYGHAQQQQQQAAHGNGGGGGYASYGGMPATPQATPQMASPWSYYTNHWPNMMTPYDPAAFYMGPYAFQSPTPMMGPGAAAGLARAAGGEGLAQSTPTRGAGQGNDGEGGEEA